MPSASVAFCGIGALTQPAMRPNATLADGIEGASAQLDSFYVFPEVARRVGDSLRSRNKRGAYDAYSKKMTFAARLNDELRELSRDKHMGFTYTTRPFV